MMGLRECVVPKTAVPEQVRPHLSQDVLAFPPQPGMSPCWSQSSGVWMCPARDPGHCIHCLSGKATAGLPTLQDTGLDVPDKQLETFPHSSPRKI